jgi:hypothetical protein
VFAPGYENGKLPYGLFPARAFAWSDTYNGPFRSGDDDAVIALDPVAGRHVSDVAGTQHISFDKVPCVLPATFQDTSVYSSWDAKCDMAGGSSGGPWLRDFNPATGTGTIFSATSKGAVNEDGTTANLSGAAFTDVVRALYEHAGNL